MDTGIRRGRALGIVLVGAFFGLPACGSYATPRATHRDGGAASEVARARHAEFDRDDHYEDDDDDEADYGTQPGALVRRLALTLAGGTYRHETSGSSLDDTTDGGLVELQGEIYQRQGVGGGLLLGGATSDDSLFEEQGILDTEGEANRLFAYLLVNPWDAQAGRFMLRVGPYLQGLVLDQSAGDEVTWSALGLRVEAEPELHFVKTKSTQLSAYVRLAGGVMGGEVEVESPGFPDQDFDVDGVTTDVDIGIRSRLGIVGVSFGYFARTVEFDESDDEGGVVVLEAESRFRGFGIQIEFEF